MRPAEDTDLSDEQVHRLRAAADGARPLNYAPYSGRMVLAAVETPEGVFGGTNIENVNFSLTKHAEEVALLAAIVSGVAPRHNWIQALYVTGFPPCGSCRQFVAEFGSDSALVIIDRIDQRTVRNRSLPTLNRDTIESWSLGDLLPVAFRRADLDQSWSEE